jgi:DNA replication protein DnaC
MPDATRYSEDQGSQCTATTQIQTFADVSLEMHAIKFSVHRDLAGFDFGVSPVASNLMHTLAETSFKQVAHNVVLVVGPSTDKTHLAAAIGATGITKHGWRMRF